MYYLIVIILAYNSGAAVESTLFTNKEACLAAQKVFQEKVPQQMGWTIKKASFCVKK